MTGAVGTLYSHLHAKWENRELWLTQCHVEHQLLHGGSFTGNSARILLKSTDKLRAICPINCLPFVDAFQSLREVVDACFGNSLSTDYSSKIERFREYFEVLLREVWDLTVNRPVNLFTMTFLNCSNTTSLMKVILISQPDC